MKRFLSFLLVVLIVVMGGVIVVTDAVNSVPDEVVIRSEHFEVTRSMLQCYYYGFYQDVTSTVVFKNAEEGNAVFLSSYAQKPDRKYDFADEKHNACTLDMNHVPNGISGSIQVGTNISYKDFVNVFGDKVVYETAVIEDSKFPIYNIGSIQGTPFESAVVVQGVQNGSFVLDGLSSSGLYAMPMFSYIGGAISESTAMRMRGGSTYTWWDYLMDHAIENVRTVLAICERAYADGYTSLKHLDPELADQVRSVVNSTKNIKSTFGKGVRKSDLQAAIELYDLAVRYQDMNRESIAAAITESEIREHYAENSALYQQIEILELEVLASEWDADYFRSLIGEFSYAKKDMDAFYDAAYQVALFEHLERLGHDEERCREAIELAKRIVDNEVYLTEKEASNDVEVVAVTIAKKISSMQTDAKLGKLDDHMQAILSERKSGDVVVAELDASGVSYHINESMTRVDTTEGNLPDSGEYGFVVIYVLEPVQAVDTWIADIRADLSEVRFDRNLEEILAEFGDSMTMDTDIIAKIS